MCFALFVIVCVLSLAPCSGMCAWEGGAVVAICVVCLYLCQCDLSLLRCMVQPTLANPCALHAALEVSAYTRSGA